MCIRDRSYTFFFLPIALFTSKYTQTGTRGLQMGKIYSAVIFATAFAPYITGEVLSRYSISGFVLLLATLITFSLFFTAKLGNIHFYYNGGLRNFRFNRSLIRGSWTVSYTHLDVYRDRSRDKTSGVRSN